MIVRLVVFLIILDLVCNNGAKATATEVLFLIVSQDNSYYGQLAQQLKADIIRQTRAASTKDNVILPHYEVDVHILHEYHHQRPGDWTLLYILSQLTRSPLRRAGSSLTTDQHIYIKFSTKWIILCEEHTQVTLITLFQQLDKLNHSKPLFLGHPLYDSEPTIIHHFAFFKNPREFPYPLLRSGVIFSYTLLQRIAAVLTHTPVDNNNNNNNVKDQNNSSYKQYKCKKKKVHKGTVGRHTERHAARTEFSIDAAHELALFIYENLETDTPASLLLHYNNKNISFETDNKENVCSKKYFETKKQPALRPTEYDSIDGEPTKDIKAEFRHMRKVILQHALFICASKRQSELKYSVGKTTQNPAETCAMHAKSLMTCPAVHTTQIYFAIKTCQKFHSERIPIIEATWAPYVKHKRYFSDVANKLIPTISVNMPNVATGHCEKTLKILRLALEEIEQWNNNLLLPQMKNPQQQEQLQEAEDFKQAATKAIKWLFLSDDDTLLSVAGVSEVIGCFAKKRDLYLGERYGYRLHAADGFNYITGGGGIVFSLPVVQLILNRCTCPSASAPDDMILGACLQSLQIKPIHSPRFHQARSNDYPLELLQLNRPVSFHKFWQMDPISVYEEWFATADRQLSKQQSIDKHVKSKKFQLKRKQTRSMPQVAKMLLKDLKQHTEL